MHTFNATAVQDPVILTVGRLCSLCKKKNAQKKLAVTVFSFPPDKGNVGTAAYLNVFGSIFKVLQNLKREGYDVGELPDSSDGLIQSVCFSQPLILSSSSWSGVVEFMTPRQCGARGLVEHTEPSRLSRLSSGDTAAGAQPD